MSFASRFRVSNYLPRSATDFLRTSYPSSTAMVPYKSKKGLGKFVRRVVRQSKRRRIGNGPTTSNIKGSQIPSSGGGESRSSTFTTGGQRGNRILASKYKKTYGVNTVHRVSGDAYSCVSNSQNVAPIGNYMDATDLTNIYSSIGQSAVDYSDSKLFMLDVHSEALITNACNLNTHAIIYDVVARLDGFTTVNTGPVTAFTLGFADGSTGAANDYLIPGATPYNNPRFVNAYKIIKQTPIILSPGQIHTHTLRYNINRTISKERLQLNGIGPIAGLTVYSIVVFHGTPYHDTATELVIGTSVAKLDIIKKDTLRFIHLQQSYPVVDITNSLSTVTAGEQWQVNAPTDTTGAT